MQVAAKEFGLGTMEGVHFNMSVGYDLKGIQSPSVTDFLDTLNEAKNSACWNECQSYLRANLDRFENIDEAFLDSIPSKICQSVAVSTMHGCPPEQISEILLYLIEEKKYHTLLKCNPTLVGEETARALLDNAGYGYMVLDPDQFAFDLKFEQAVPLIKELAEAAKKAGVQFAVKLSNTLPVSIKEKELRGSDNQGLMQTANGYLFREGDTVKEVADRNALPELYKLALDAFEQAHPRNDA